MYGQRRGGRNGPGSRYQARKYAQPKTRDMARAKASSSGLIVIMTTGALCDSDGKMRDKKSDWKAWAALPASSVTRAYNKRLQNRIQEGKDKALEREVDNHVMANVCR